MLYSASPFDAALIVNVEPTSVGTRSFDHFEADEINDFDLADVSGLQSENAFGFESEHLLLNDADSLPLEQVQSHELVVVDTAADNYEQLINDLLSNGDTSRNFEIVLLDASRDGVEQFSEALGQHDDLSGVHIVSHGTDGAVKLGNIWLSASNLSEYAAEISGWQDVFGGDADLLFYGCDLARSGSGQTLQEGVQALTGADVAGRTDEPVQRFSVATGSLNFRLEISRLRSRLAK